MNTERLSAYIELTKPRIMLMVLVTTVLGYCFANNTAAAGVAGMARWDFIRNTVAGPLIWALLGTALTCAGAAVLNQYLERDADALMARTRNRPIPSGTVTPAQALEFGTVLILIGLAVLCWKVNLLTAFLSLLTCFLYVLVYTPMKKISWLNTTIGAIPGALPPMGGWAAATNTLDTGAWILFFILFTWQHPHFYAIAWMYKEDYQKAGFKMLPVVYPDGRLTFSQIMAFTFALVAFSVMPSMIRMSGMVYFWGAVVLGCGFLLYAWQFRVSQSHINARKVLAASVIYLPLLLVLLIVDVMIRYV